MQPNQSSPSLPCVDPGGVTPRTTRVLHVINGEHYSGAERVQDLLASTLPEFGYDVAFACVKPGTFDANRQNRSAPLLNVAMRSRFDLTAARRLARVFREQKCEILHAHTPRSLMVASSAAKILGCPLVYHVHSPVGRDSKRKWINRLNTWSESRNLTQATRLICVSNSLRDYMLGMGHPEEKIRVVHNGVATSPREIELGNKSVFWTLGMVALFRPRKGVEVLLEAMRLLCEQNLPVRLKCVGAFESAEYELEVLELAQTLNVGHLIEWTGFERDVKSRLKEMQIMVLPSQFGEGLPMVVLEAMAVGLPVIASKVEGIPEAIRDGQDGLLFTPNNPEELAGQIRQLVKNRSLWHEISHSAWQRQRSEFSDRSMAARIASVYDELR